MNVVFPNGGGWILRLVYWLLKGIMSWGWVSYGFAIVFLTLFLRLVLTPLDFFNKYLTRKNQIKQQALSAELADLERAYGDDPMAFMRARQELFRKHGVGGGAGALVTLVSLVVTLVLFFNVMSALNNISKINIAHQYEALQAVFTDHAATVAEIDTIKAKYVFSDTMSAEERAAQQAALDAELVPVAAPLRQALNETYQKTQISFLWVKNIWRPDTFWTDSVLTAKDFNKAQSYIKLDEAGQETYETIYSYIDAKNHSNGWLLLAVIAAVATFVSTKLSGMMTARNAPQQKKEKPEEIITYSLRDAKNRTAAAQPSVDPAQVAKMMMWIMPVIYLIFGINQTAAFVIYMIASSLITTGLTFAFSLLVDAIIKVRRPRWEKKKQQDFDASIINPHAKYFKGGRK